MSAIDAWRTFDIVNGALQRIAQCHTGTFRSYVFTILLGPIDDLGHSSATDGHWDHRFAYYLLCTERQSRKPRSDAANLDV